ncbi:hypothetical protein HMPREF0322_00665 [Desulfitobacterium hafniense DP7]|uniref:Uncharacterized protein n=1 Tax=Desulfitobacterium hafniense DP7 TaxID=537010 RepID=G9XI89_DESHA|nr:hypothetical protein [Desulfitobacterium hafniense]EHL08572.1 hypothetical protein HMPREF0322_00665 [Desulfitobacterium hafniense DP7]
MEAQGLEGLSGIFPSEKEKLKPKIGFPVLRLQFFLNYIPTGKYHGGEPGAKP